MFTGLIEEVGTLQHISRQGEALVLTIRASKVLEGVRIGDSISVNGVCLTAIRFDAASVAMDVMPETFRKTTLSRLVPGDRVNLERAMLATARFGGHIVQGHVDGTGVIRERGAVDNAVYFTIEPHDPSLFRYIIAKGSIAIDGISLTVVDSAERTFRVSIIPHTLAETVLQHKTPGDDVNLETDIVGKYVEHLLSWTGGAGASGRGAARRGGGLSEAFFKEHGYM
ncbi:riboflavin synthase [Paenibacillus antri]|uniref:Riboflavin synthase n=1 Tax=Paenibacillus antri TaxID=2582848 RepID=A0A5R9G9D3_9BACL|nr:riboflavin synthase [Paenibacillus antri]TLS53042.1 riboflavin synthase [Paenibacillus antri]